MIKNFVKRSEKKLPEELGVFPTPHRQRNIIAVFAGMSHTSRLAFATEEEFNIFEGTLKALIELHAHKITGLNQGYERKEGFFQPMASTAKIQWRERFGKPITGFLKKLGTLQASQSVGLHMSPSFNVVFFEPDPTNSVVVEAWLMNDLVLSSFNSEEASKDFMRKRNKPLDIVAEFKGSTYRGQKAIEVAQKHLDLLTFASSNPHSVSLSTLRNAGGSILTENDLIYAFKNTQS